MSGFEEFMDNLRERTFMCYPGIGSNSFKYDYSHVEQAYQAGRADRQEQDTKIAYNDGTTCDEFTNTSCSAGYVIAKAIREAG